MYTLAAVKRRQRVCWNEPARLVFFYITVITRQLLDLWCPLKHKHANCLPKSVSSFVITEAESFNNLAHCQRVRQHKCARKRRERKRAACVVVYNMFSCWLKNNTNPWTAEFFFFMFMYYTAVLSQQYVCTFTHTSIPICTGREGFKRFSFRFRFLSQCRLCWRNNLAEQ